MKKYLLFLPFSLLVPKVVLAHCPLCTAGAGALALVAASLGVSSVVVGVFIGAFSVALGLWIAGLMKREYVQCQKTLVTGLIFLGTVIPVMPFIRHYGPLYVPFLGEYGTTYTVNLYILGVLIGLIVMLVSPYLSRMVTRMRGQQLPFQGITITMFLLIVVSLIIQFVWGV